MIDETAGRDATIAQRYAELYGRKNPGKVYPVEFVVRTLLGTYPGLRIDRTTYAGAKVLDVGFGDGRNMPLLDDLSFEIFGVEISEEICRLTRERMRRLGIPVILKTGRNSHLPFRAGEFDLVLSCHSCYYVSEGETFADNLHEIARVLRPGGRFLFSLAKTDGYLLHDSIPLGHGHHRITSDPSGLRNGTILRAFATRDEVRAELGAHFEDLALGLCENDFYGLYEKVWIGTGLKKVP